MKNEEIFLIMNFIGLIFAFIAFIIIFLLWHLLWGISATDFKFRSVWKPTVNDVEQLFSDQISVSKSVVESDELIISPNSIGDRVLVVPDIVLQNNEAGIRRVAGFPRRGSACRKIAFEVFLEIFFEKRGEEAREVCSIFFRVRRFHDLTLGLREASVAQKNVRSRKCETMVKEGRQNIKVGSEAVVATRAVAHAGEGSGLQSLQKAFAIREGRVLDVLEELSLLLRQKRVHQAVRVEDTGNPNFSSILEHLLDLLHAAIHNTVFVEKNGPAVFVEEEGRRAISHDEVIVVELDEVVGHGGNSPQILLDRVRVEGEALLFVDGEGILVNDSHSGVREIHPRRDVPVAHDADSSLVPLHVLEDGPHAVAKLVGIAIPRVRFADQLSDDLRFLPAMQHLGAVDPGVDDVDVREFFRELTVVHGIVVDVAVLHFLEPAAGNRAGHNLFDDGGSGRLEALNLTSTGVDFHLAVDVAVECS